MSTRRAPSQGYQRGLLLMFKSFHLGTGATDFDIAALKTAAFCSYIKPWRGGVTAARWAASVCTTS